jgi:hypothetical protein
MNLGKPILNFTAGLALAAAIMFSACALKPKAITPVTLPGLSPPVRISVGDAGAAEPAVAISPDGSAYAVWVAHRQAEADVMLARVTADGRVDGPPVRVNPQAGTATAWRGDPPTIALAPDGNVFVGWTARVQTESGQAADINISVSRDRGRSFDPPVKINDDSKPAEHGMHSLTIARDGRVYVAWLDERNVAPMPMKNEKMEMKTGGKHTENNRELFIANSSDGGRSFSKNERVATNVCPCCKTALVTNSAGRLFIAWRQVLPGDFRHIAVATSPDQGRTFTSQVIVSDDQWVLSGCPVSGAALSASGDGSVRVLWYSEGKNGQTGLYSSITTDNGVTFGARQLVAATVVRGTPVLINRADGPAAIWQEFENNSAVVRLSPRLSGANGSDNLVIAAGGELPAAAFGAGKLFVTYIAKSDPHPAVWLVVADK